MTIAAAEESGVLRWSVSFALALTLHVLAIGVFLGEGRAGEADASSPLPILLDLIALPAEPQVVPDESMAAAPDAPLPPTAVDLPAEGATESPPSCDPQAPAPSASGSAAMTLAEWRRLLRHHLARYQQYPEDAQRKGQQGTPHVFFTVCHDGRVLEAHIARTSGIASLDQAGMDLVRRAEPLPAFPQGLPEDRLNLVVPVEFVLAKARR